MRSSSAGAVVAVRRAAAASASKHSSSSSSGITTYARMSAAVRATNRSSAAAAASAATSTMMTTRSFSDLLNYPVVSKNDFGEYLEYSVIHTNRSLNLMSDPFQRVMKDLNKLLKTTYNAEKVAIIPGWVCELVNLLLPLLVMHRWIFVHLRSSLTRETEWLCFAVFHWQAD